MRGDLRLEIPEAVPAEALVEIHLSEGHCAPFLCLRQRASVVTVHGGYHPVAGGIGVRAADDVDVILASARRAQHGITAPNRPGDHLRAVIAEAAGNFRKETSGGILIY